MRDWDDLLSAQHLGFGNRTNRQNEGQQKTDDDAGHRQRQFDLLEHLPPRGTEIGGGIASFIRHHGDPQRHRKQHEGEINIDHAKDNDGKREQDAFHLPAEQ